MKRDKSFLFLIILMSSLITSYNTYGQRIRLFSENQLDSLHINFHPIYKSDSIKMSKISDFDLLNLFVFNGDCSLCLGKMRDAEIFFENYGSEIESIFIVETNDTIQFNFYRDRFNIKTIVLWDENRLMRKKDINIDDTQMCLIDRRGFILLNGDFVNDDSLKNKYLEKVSRQGN